MVILPSTLFHFFNINFEVILIFLCFVDRSEKEERRRNRRSRWGDADNKVPVTMMPQQPGVIVPGLIGQQSCPLPPAKAPQSKLKNPMLTKVSRSDPGLLQYARQTYGSLDLSEEQWKKAEDHYKVNSMLRIHH